MVTAYKKQHGQERDLWFELAPGQCVLLRQRLPGKLHTHCSGPYVFLRSLGPNPTTLELLGPNGKVPLASVGNFVPSHGSADQEVSRPNQGARFACWGPQSSEHCECGTWSGTAGVLQAQPV